MYFKLFVKNMLQSSCDNTMSFHYTLFKEFSTGVAKTTGSLIVLAAFWNYFVIDLDNRIIKKNVKEDANLNDRSFKKLFDEL